jgi:hypothetical protein
MSLAMRANLSDPPVLSVVPIISLICGFILFNAIAVLAMLRRFSIQV